MKDTSDEAFQDQLYRQYYNVVHSIISCYVSGKYIKKYTIAIFMKARGKSFELKQKSQEELKTWFISSAMACIKMHKRRHFIRYALYKRYEAFTFNKEVIEDSINNHPFCKYLYNSFNEDELLLYQLKIEKRASIEEICFQRKKNSICTYFEIKKLYRRIQSLRDSYRGDTYETK